MVLYPGDLATQEQQPRGEVWISERNHGEERKGEKGKKGYTGHKAAKSSTRAPATQARTCAQALIVLQLPPI